jgi:hypothetical protein
MISLMVFAVFGAMVGLVAFELVEEVRGGKHKLQDRYHE